MTGLSLTLRRPRVKHSAVAASALLVVGTIAAGLTLHLRGPANAVTMPIPPARAAALIEATTGASSTEMQAVGEQAQIINARLPFAGGPLQSARPFALTGSDVDERRALLCLTQAIYYEAGFEPLEGRRAVAQVVLNRLRHPAFPKSVCGVVYQHNSGGICQFTFVCDGALYRRPAADAWRQAETIARAALAGYVDGTVGEATHYHANYVAPRWAPLLAKVAQIGQHIFYRWPGAWGERQSFVGRYIGEPRDPMSMRPPMPTTIAESSEPAAPVSGPITDGTVLKRAPNDVGGLLDTSKGWTLNIPGPDETSSAAKLIASQEHRPAPQQELAANGGPPVVASR